MTLTIGSLPDWLPTGLTAYDIQFASQTKRIRVTDYVGLDGNIVAIAQVKQSTEGRASIYGAQNIQPGDGSYTGNGLITEVAENHSANEPDRTEVSWLKQP
jgi:hypothetical protein